MPRRSPFSLEGKTALIAGASRGIGLAIAEHMADAGARAILAARSMEKLEEHVSRLRDEGLQADPLRLDISDSDSVRTAMDGLPDVDILVNVAGTNLRKPFQEYTRNEYGHLMRTNLDGLVELTQQVGERMVARRKGGKIVMIGSLMSLLGLPYLTVYAITKSALAGLTRTLAAEWGRYNIQVNCIAPGFILTDLNRTMWQAGKMRDWLLGVQANPEMGTPADVAPLAVFLSSSGANYITGQVIAVDGGYSTTANWPFQP
jgi:gluconate 5-dehydrogenase